jgi:hypothetical protein
VSAVRLLREAAPSLAALFIVVIGGAMQWLFGRAKAT